MSYRKGLQILMMAVLLVSTLVLSAEAQEPASSTAQQQWKALQEQVTARDQAGDYAGAEQLARQALALAERAFGPEHPATAVSLNNLANVLQAQGRYGEAEPLHRRALAIREKALGAEHPDTADSLNYLGVCRTSGCFW